VVWVVVLWFIFAATLVASNARMQRPHATVKGSTGFSLAQLTEIADKMNRGLPMMVDKSTQFDVVTPAPQRLILHYTIQDPKIYKIQVEILRKSMKEYVLTAVCTNPDIRPLLDVGIIVEYSYKQWDGTYIMSFEIHSGDCR
jgi:hypothetical protein